MTNFTLIAQLYQQALLHEWLKPQVIICDGKHHLVVCICIFVRLKGSYNYCWWHQSDELQNEIRMLTSMVQGKSEPTLVSWLFGWEGSRVIFSCFTQMKVLFMKLPLFTEWRYLAHYPTHYHITQHISIPAYKHMCWYPDNKHRYPIQINWTLIMSIRESSC